MQPFQKDPRQRARINNQIRAPQLRIIDDAEGNLGVMTLADALAKAREKGVDLVEISPDAVPPVAKIIDYGKFQYEQKKKQKNAHGPTVETKILQVKIGTGEHDLELKARKASSFLKEGHRVKIDLFLAGRAKYMQKEFLEDRLNRVLLYITENYKITDGPKRGPKGLYIILERNKA